MTEREKLIKELDKIIPCSCISAYTERSMSAPDCAQCNYIEEIADFILEDRKNVVAPFLNSLRKLSDPRSDSSSHIEAQELIKKYGVNNDPENK